MVTDISTGISYVFQNITHFGGDPNRSETQANALFMDVLGVELSARKFKLAQNQMIEKFPQVEWNVLQKFLVIHIKLWDSLHHLFPLWLYLDS
jgi:hypothetical protein